MGFYIRKSFRAGPIRLNLSKSGLGLSAGVTGLRVGTGPRGTYVHGGRGPSTNRRVLLVDTGTWDTRINQILDVTLSSETNLVELTVDGRKNAVYLTAPDAPALAVKIEQAVEAVP